MPIVEAYARIREISAAYQGRVFFGLIAGRLRWPLSRLEVVLYGVGGFWSDLARRLVLALPMRLP